MVARTSSRADSPGKKESPPRDRSPQPRACSPGTSLGSSRVGIARWTTFRLTGTTTTSTAPAWFPIVNASTTDFRRPFAMSLKRDEIMSGHQLLHVRVRLLKFLTNEKTLPDSQLWGAHFGEF